MSLFYSWFYIYLLFIYLLERGVKERERERNTNVWEKNLSAASQMSLTRDLAHYPGMCSHLESNWWPFALWDDVQPTEPHQSGLFMILVT